MAGILSGYLCHIDYSHVRIRPNFNIKKDDFLKCNHLTLGDGLKARENIVVEGKRNYAVYVKQLESAKSFKM